MTDTPLEAQSSRQPSLDYVLPFRLDGHNIHGRVVQLSDLATQVLTRHDYPEAVNRLLGEALVLVSMLGTMLKFDGRFILQLHGKGAISTLMVDYAPHAEGVGEMRGFAQFDEAAVHEALKQDTSPMGLLGEGSHMAFTVDQGADMERYQGIVPLEGETLAEAALEYFQRSEQIGTSLKLAAAPLLLAGGKVEWRAGGIVVQQTAATGGIDLPPEGDPDYVDEEWNRLKILLETTQDSELLDADIEPQTLAFRLFHEEGVRVFDTRPLRFACPCSRDRVHNMLRGLPEDDQKEMQTQETIEIHCDFCNEQYVFAPHEAFVTSSQD
ncbi:MAG: Hsp33 family molecular chaperone HslO [Alphaproteobacteria bacterium]|nr:Hsp33 family molecular chaperone HslO [Alphaproteobacteria bacterium]